jgi:hypothetical protein
MRATETTTDDLADRCGDRPGTAVMAARKDRIRYEYVETPDGGRVNITTGDRHVLRNHSGILVQPLHRDWMTRGSTGPR